MIVVINTHPTFNHSTVSLNKSNGNESQVFDEIAGKHNGPLSQLLSQMTALT